MAVLACLMANINRNADKHPAPFTIEEFMPKFGEEPQEVKPKVQPWQEQLEIVKMIGAAHRGTE